MELAVNGAHHVVNKNNNESGTVVVDESTAAEKPPATTTYSTPARLNSSGRATAGDSAAAASASSALQQQHHDLTTSPLSTNKAPLPSTWSDGMPQSPTGALVPRKYANVNNEFPPSHSDYENMAVQWNSTESLEVVRKIGWGKYSIVFEGVRITDNRRVVLKVLKPVRKKKILREIKVLETLRGGPNVVDLLDVVRDSGSRTPALVFEHIQNNEPKALYASLTLRDVAFYIFQLLRTLDFSHSRGIMHRDVKPHNVMIDHERRVLRLIDWGLADFYHRDREYSVRVASRHHKGPELLLDNSYYDYSLDIWSVGCMFAGIIFQKDPFFCGRDNIDQLVKIARVLGTADLHTYVTRYNLQLNPQIRSALTRWPKKPWAKFITKYNEHLCTPDAIRLLDRMLVYDHQQRILPCEAMLHPFFDDVRDECLG